jgi:hypothetical protein
MDQLTRIERSLGALEGKIDLMLARDTEHDKRIKSLEETRTKWGVYAGMAGAVVGYLAKLLGVLAICNYVAQGVLPPEMVSHYVYVQDYVAGSV